MKKIIFVSHCILNTASKVVMYDQEEMDSEEKLRKQFLQKAIVVGKFFLIAEIFERLIPAKQNTCHFIFLCSFLVPCIRTNTFSYILYKANPYITGKLNINNITGSINDFNVFPLKKELGESIRPYIALIKIMIPHNANITSKKRLTEEAEKARENDIESYRI